MPGNRSTSRLTAAFLLLACALLTCALLAAPTAAQVTVTTDEASYAVGDLVLITLHNAGAEAVDVLSEPGVVVWYVDEGTCVWGCTGLPVVWRLQAGETVVYSHDTGAEPESPGLYRVTVSVMDPPPGSVTSVDYVLAGEVPTDARSWGALKSAYR